MVRLWGVLRDGVGGDVGGGKGLGGEEGEEGGGRVDRAEARLGLFCKGAVGFGRKR